MARSASPRRASRPRAAPMGLASCSGVTRRPLNSASAAERAMPAPSTSEGTVESARIARADRATALKRPTPISKPAVAEMTSSS